MMITAEDIASESEVPAGRIGDLRAQVIPEDMKARLSWSSPDIGGQSVSRYQVKYAFNVQDITDGFETKATPWGQRSGDSAGARFRDHVHFGHVPK
jgi:calcium-activated chloride channel regulator 4